ncbi:MAG: response regulator, partial [Desulfobacterales bacterium]|nr:response regulator [Desulfobacterales bacterium]
QNKTAKETVKITEQRIINAQKFILGSSAVIFFIAMAWGFFISRLISKPIKELSDATGQIGKGQLDVKIEATSKDEIGQLAVSFNKMIKALQLITVSRDAFASEVAERKKASESLRKSEEKLSGIVNSITDSMIIVDEQYNVVWNNYIAVEIFGADMVGKKCYKAYHGRDEVCEQCIAVACFKDGKVHDFETTITEADGGQISFWCTASVAAWHEDGRPKMVVEFLRNITERKQAEKALQGAYDQAIIYAEHLKEQIEERTRAVEAKEKLETQLLRSQKMEAIGTLAGGIAHDFNNLLQVISGYAQLLLLKKDVKDTDYLYLKQIDESTQKATELTKQILIFGRKVESKLIALSLNQEIIKIHKLFQRTIPKMIDIELHLAEDLKFINADPLQLEQILMNLGLNARDAMPDGGKLTFETKNLVLDEAYCKTHVDFVPREYVLLEISDTGHGIDKETLEHIFEPFYTTKKTGKGTGLGLAIVYGIVGSHGGHIICYSEPGQGATFKIYFPALLMDGIEQGLEPEDEAVIRGGHETLLIIDDEETLRNQGRDMLAKYGYTAITSETGERAIEIYEKEKDRIDLVILDIGMPGMGGYKCLEQLVKIDPEIKVIVASGYTTSARVEELLKFGAADFIDKPYRLRDMFQRIRRVLDQDRSSL